MRAPQAVAVTGSDPTTAAEEDSSTSLLEGYLESSVVSRPQLGEWLASPTRDIHARLVHLSFADPPSSPSFSSSSSSSPEEPEPSLVGDDSSPSTTTSSSGPLASPSCSHTHTRSFSRSQPRYPQSLKSITTASHPSGSLATSGASMAPTCIHQSSTASQHPPSLYHYSDATTPTETSVATEQAAFFQGVHLLEDVNGVLEVRHPIPPSRPLFECAFWFLSCSYISDNHDEWLVHCLSHFRGEEPPRRVSCPVCSDFSFECASNGWTAWGARMAHVAGHHLVGTSLRASRPDFHLFQHLWQKRLIDDQDLKELKGGNHNLTRPPENFTVTGRMEGRGRRGTPRGVRRQHVGAVGMRYSR